MTTSSLTRILAVLDLLTPGRPEITPDEIAESLGISRPTSYRYVRELVAAGLLRRTGESRVTLGARIIELDYQMRITDPLLRAARPEMESLARRTGFSVTLVALLGQRMITLHLVQGAEPIDISYGRGRPMPVLRGTPSITLLAHLPRARQRALFETEAPVGAEAEAAWERLRRRLRTVRRNGFGVSEGELDPHNAGVAVPVSGTDGKPVASLCAVVPRHRFELLNVDELDKRLRQAAADITSGLADPAGAFPPGH
jgi:DNA-binding IclR family transcriptional regulator